MIWFALALLACIALAPLVLALRRGQTARGRRESDLALHRAQLAELDSDLAEGRIGVAEHKEARLEVQRRLLAADAAPDAVPDTAPDAGPDAGLGSSRRPGRFRVPALLLLVPIGALGLYLAGGSPGLPGAPISSRIAQARVQEQEAGRLIADLRTNLAGLDPHSPQARAGYILLGDAESARGNFAAAAAAWRTALLAGFDPTLAAQAAEAASRAEGHVSAASAELFRKALAAAPQDAPWRPMVEQRLTEVPKG